MERSVWTAPRAEWTALTFVQLSKTSTRFELFLVKLQSANKYIALILFSKYILAHFAPLLPLNPSFCGLV